MIDLALSTPIQDASVFQFPLELVSQLLQEVSSEILCKRYFSSVDEMHFYVIL